MSVIIPCCPHFPKCEHNQNQLPLRPENQGGERPIDEQPDLKKNQPPAKPAAKPEEIEITTTRTSPVATPSAQPAAKPAAEPRTRPIPKTKPEKADTKD